MEGLLSQMILGIAHNSNGVYHTLQNPGTTDDDSTCSIVFTVSIRTGRRFGAQVILTENGLIAKVYDPLYHSFVDKYYKAGKVDVATEADLDYTTEAAAYSTLCDTDTQGGIMPKYYGSWTTKVRTTSQGQEHLRNVRILLIEYVRGKAMNRVSPYDLKQGERKNIMRKVIETDTDLKIAGVDHDDLEPRNIVLSRLSDTLSTDSETSVSASFDAPGLRVCIIDYGCSCVDQGKELLEEGCRNP